MITALEARNKTSQNIDSFKKGISVNAREALKPALDNIYEQIAKSVENCSFNTIVTLNYTDIMITNIEKILKEDGYVTEYAPRFNQLHIWW